ncbi:MAG: MCE family protein [Streptosporangiales bacterium]|nr:MCE family protein [Streptosporangiales bacterium]
MRTASAGVKLTIFMVITALATGLLSVTIADAQFLDARSYRAAFSDVTGLIDGDDVRIAGVRVGEVTDIEVYQRDKALVTFTVQDEVPLGKSTRAAIRYRTLVGQRYMALYEGPGGPATRLPDNGMIPMAQTQPPLDLTVLLNGFKPLFRALSPEQVNRLAYEIIQVLQGEAGTVNSLLAHVASLTNTLADRDAVIGSLIDNLNQVLATLNERDERLSQLIAQLQTLVSGLSADRDAIGDALVNINDLAGATQGLLRESRPAIDADVEQLLKLSTTLDKNEEIIDGWLNRLPGKLNMINRTASYGSWFNFYLCGLDAQVQLPTGSYRLPQVRNQTPRCNPS